MSVDEAPQRNPYVDRTEPPSSHHEVADDVPDSMDASSSAPGPTTDLLLRFLHHPSPASGSGGASRFPSSEMPTPSRISPDRKAMFEGGSSKAPVPDRSWNAALPMMLPPPSQQESLGQEVIGPVVTGIAPSDLLGAVRDQANEAIHDAPSQGMVTKESIQIRFARILGGTSEVPQKYQGLEQGLVPTRGKREPRFWYK